MADAVEVAIESALLNRLNSLVLTPAVPVVQPNVTPSAALGTRYIEPTFMPASSFALGIPNNAYNQHYGIFQIDVRGPLGEGDLAPRRIAAAVGAWFKRGTQLTKDGFVTTLYEAPDIRQGVKDDPWWKIRIDIKYRCFARPPG